MSTIAKFPIYIHPNVGKVVGEFWHSDDPADLSEDMLEVQLSEGRLVDVGWVPDYEWGHGNKGAYRVRVTIGTHVVETSYATDPKVAVRWIEKLANYWSQGVYS